MRSFRLTALLVIGLAVLFSGVAWADNPDAAKQELKASVDAATQKLKSAPEPYNAEFERVKALKDKANQEIEALKHKVQPYLDEFNKAVGEALKKYYKKLRELEAEKQKHVPIIHGPKFLFVQAGGANSLQSRIQETCDKYSDWCKTNGLQYMRSRQGITDPDKLREMAALWHRQRTDRYRQYLKEIEQIKRQR